MKKINLRKKWTAIIMAFCMMATTAVPISAMEAKTPDNAAGKANTVMALVDTVNDTWESPAGISLGINYESELTETNTVDYYEVTIPSSGTVNLRLSSYVQERIKYTVYSQHSGNEIWSGEGRLDSVSGRYYGNHDIQLTQGTYIIQVSQRDSSDFGKYNFTVTHTSTGESFPESGDGTNNSMETASPISLGNTYKGLIALNDMEDFYKFSAKAGQYIITASSGFHTDCRLFNGHGQEVASMYVYGQMYDSVITETERIIISEAGDYYFYVHGEYLGSNDDYLGDYTFSITEYIPVLTATTSYTKTYISDSYYQDSFYLDAKSSGKEAILYASSDNKVVTVNEYGVVTVKGPGKAVITATVEGFPTIQKKITVTVKPAKVASLKVKRTAKNKMTVSWKRDKTVTGYEITYALNKKFTKGKKTVKIGKNKTVKKTIKKLNANKAYYVKVRAYKTSGGEKIYGAYSKTVKVKIKK